MYWLHAYLIYMSVLTASNSSVLYIYTDHCAFPSVRSHSATPLSLNFPERPVILLGFGQYPRTYYTLHVLAPVVGCVNGSHSSDRIQMSENSLNLGKTVVYFSLLGGNYIHYKLLHQWLFALMDDIQQKGQKMLEQSTSFKIVS